MKNVKFQYLKFVTDFEDFKQKFPKVEHGNGVVSMRNKIAYQWFSNLEVRRYCKANGYNGLIYLFRSNERLAHLVFDIFKDTLRYLDDTQMLWLNENEYIKSPLYTNKTPLCDDGTSVDGYVHYQRIDDVKTYKMRLGKMLEKHWDLTEFGRIIPQSMRIYIAELLVKDLKAYARKNSGIKLHVDDDFDGIYNQSRYEDGADFHSCMVGRGYADFYSHFDANAAYLTNANDKIVARCILWNKVHCNGKTMRFADRQYADKQDEAMMQTLIDKLKEEGYIDAYKPVGSGCSGCEESVNVIQEDGTIYHRYMNMRVICDRDVIDYDGDIPYMDTFAWASGDTLYNTDDDVEYELKNTDGYAKTHGVYDSWHEEYVSEVKTVYYNGVDYTCDRERLDDFRWIERLEEWHHYEDTIYCENCHEYELREYEFYSDLTEEWYCCEDCLYYAEREYKENNWYQASWDDEYYEDYEYVQVWETDHYQEYTMGDTMIEDMLESGELAKIDGEYYMGVSFLGLPFGEI